MRRKKIHDIGESMAATRVLHLTLTESDVCRRQILTSKVGPRAVRLNIFIMVVDP